MSSCSHPSLITHHLLRSLIYSHMRLCRLFYFTSGGHIHENPLGAKLARLILPEFQPFPCSINILESKRQYLFRIRLEMKSTHISFEPDLCHDPSHFLAPLNRGITAKDDRNP